MLISRQQSVVSLQWIAREPVSYTKSEDGTGKPSIKHQRDSAQIRSRSEFGAAIEGYGMISKKAAICDERSPPVDKSGRNGGAAARETRAGV